MESQKLSGRQAVKAMLDGQRIKRFETEYWINRGAITPQCNRQLGNKVQFSDILEFNDWEIVRAPMSWEGETVSFDLPYFIRLSFPFNSEWEGKRVRVRVEEII